MNAQNRSGVIVNCGHSALPLPAPSFDALAASFGALSVAIAIGSILVGLLSIAVTVVWNRSTKAEAILAARETAEAATLIFMRQEGHDIIMRKTSELASGTTGNGGLSGHTGAIFGDAARGPDDPDLLR